MAEIDQCLLAADARAVQHPLVGMAPWQRQSGLNQGLERLGPEHLGERRVVEEVGAAHTLSSPGLGAPQPPLGIESGPAGRYGRRYSTVAEPRSSAGERKRNVFRG